MGKPQRRLGKEFEAEAVRLVEVSGRTRRSHDNGARAVWVGREANRESQAADWRVGSFYRLNARDVRSKQRRSHRSPIANPTVTGP